MAPLNDAGRRAPGARALLLLLLGIGAPGCLPAGDEPYVGWSEARSEDGGFSIRYLAPPWEVDLATVAPSVGLEVPFQHAAPVGLPDPPPAYALVATPGLAGATDQLSAGAEQVRALEGDVVVAPTRPFTTRSGLVGHEMISVDVWSRFHRETFADAAGRGGAALAREQHDADARDANDMLSSLEALE
jgi:hypothetical protein